MDKINSYGIIIQILDEISFYICTNLKYVLERRDSSRLLIKEI